MYNATFYANKTVTETKTIKNKNGVELRVVTKTETNVTLHYELYMDGELVNKYKDAKTANAMWKDFSA